MTRCLARRAWPASLAMLLLTGTPAAAQEPPSPPKTVGIAPGVKGVLDAFSSRPIVALADNHGLAQELDFYAAVVRDPRFAAEVGNLVVEFGSAARQDTLDRYLSGEIVPYTELRKTWSDTVGGAWTHLGYMNLLAQVRAINMALPVERRIRVLLGDPPIDWSKIDTKAELTPYELRRDAYPAELIRREILAEGKKALVIYGGWHLRRDSDLYIKGAAADPRAEAVLRRFFRNLAAGSPDYTTMTPSQADQSRSMASGWKVELGTYGDLKSVAFHGRTPFGDMFVLQFANATVTAAIHLNEQGKIDVLGIQRVADDGDRSITDRIEEAFPASVFYVVPYTGSSDKAVCTERFELARANWTAPTLVAGGVAEGLTAGGCGAGATAIADGLLYLGLAVSLTMSPQHPDIYLDEAYRQEQSRRRQIWAEALPRAADMRDYPSTAKPYP